MINPFSFVASAASAGFRAVERPASGMAAGRGGLWPAFCQFVAQHATRRAEVRPRESVHEDDRFVPSGRAGPRSRLLYALESTLQSRDDSGRGFLLEPRFSRRRVLLSRIGNRKARAALVMEPSTSVSRLFLRRASISPASFFIVEL